MKALLVAVLIVVLVVICASAWVRVQLSRRIEGDDE